MKILVGYDGSNAAKEAMDSALKSAQAFQATVSVVTSMVKGTEENQNEIEQAERVACFLLKVAGTRQRNHV